MYGTLIVDLWYKVSSVMSSMAAASHNQHLDGFIQSVLNWKLAFVVSTLQKLLSSSGSVRDGGVCVKKKRGGISSFVNQSSTPHYEEGTSVNRHHSRGIKKPLHCFVLEAVLLICLPMNECVGPVFLLARTMALGLN